jgi:DNA-binding XRE family transcriptional regulator
MTSKRSEDGARPTRRQANIVRSRARLGHNEDQLARGIGVTRETMRKWAKTDKDFAEALQAALMISQDYWDRVDEETRQRDANSS